MAGTVKFMGLAAIFGGAAKPAHPDAEMALIFQPAELLAAGILSDPNTPEGAAKKARGLVRHGSFEKARELLSPHRHTANKRLRLTITELLGVSIGHLGGAWQAMLETTLTGHIRYHDPPAVARLHLQLGELHLLYGDLDRAAAHLHQADRLYTHAGDTVRRAWVGSLRARLQLRRGRLKEAQATVDHALVALVRAGHNRIEGLTRLDRARIVATMGDSAGAAREVVAAERILAPAGNPSDLLGTRLTHAQTLIIVGQHRRAAAGLRRLRGEVLSHGDVLAQAFYHEQLGRALADRDAAEARRTLSRARHLYQKLNSKMGVVSCDLLLVRVEGQLGLNPMGRLRRLRAEPIDSWPHLAAELKLTRAEVIANDDPAKAESLLLAARAFALDSGNRALVQRIDAVLNPHAAAPPAPRSVAAGDQVASGRDGLESTAEIPDVLRSLKLLASRGSRSATRGLRPPPRVGVAI